MVAMRAMSSINSWRRVDGFGPALDASIETDAVDNWKPSKTKSRERIDGIVALIMGLDRTSRQEEFRSVYDKRGPLMFYLVSRTTRKPIWSLV
jgi:hypothetical protein